MVTGTHRYTSDTTLFPIHSGDLTFSSQQMEMLSQSPIEPEDWYGWRTQVYQQFRSRMTDDKFPCPFSRKSFQKGSQTFCFLESTEEYELHRFGAALLQYLDGVERAGPSGNPFMPLLAFVRPSAETRSLADDHRQCWAIMQFLHDHDPKPWPSDTPTDPDHHLWSFCFNGVQLFFNFSAPGHQVQRSRNLGDAIVLVINPRRNFDVVAGNTPEGHAVRHAIRHRVEVYQGHPAVSDLGTYGDPENREWWQYQADEPASPRPPSCPLKIRRHETELVALPHPS